MPIKIDGINIERTDTEHINFQIRRQKMEWGRKKSQKETVEKTESI